jgi:filamentous hemagglutinin family protein
MQRFRTSALAFACPLFASFVIAWTSTAQTVDFGVIRDGSIGPNVPEGETGLPDARPLECDYCIDENLGEPIGGRNLFHSFSKFDIGPGERALFSAGSDVDNILARIVTEGTKSHLQGTVAVSGASSPSLFLINPSGILFSGEFDAMMDSNAALYVTTADGVQFPDGLFDASTDASPTGYPTEEPTALRFSGGVSGDIELNSAQLTCRNCGGDGLTLAGGRILDTTPEGEATGISILGGQVQLAAMGTAAIDVPLDLSSLDVRQEGTPELGAIEVGSESSAFQINVFGISGGRVVIRGGELKMINTSNVAQGNGVELDAFNFKVTGAIKIDGDPGAGALQANANVITRTTGSVRLAADELEITNAAKVVLTGNLDQSSGCNPCESGEIEINVDRLTLDGPGSGIRSEAAATAAAGAIDIDASQIVVRDGASIGSGPITGGSFTHGGDIDIAADEIRLESGGQIQSLNRDQVRTGGAVRIHQLNANHQTDLYLQENSRIGTDTEGGGASGTLEIDIDGLLSVSSGIVGTQTTGGGRSGNVTISANQIELGREHSSSNAAQVGQITTTTEGSGPAGGLTITANESLFIAGEGEVDGDLTNSGVFARSGLGPGSNATGSGGDIVIGAGSLELRDGGGIEVQTFGPGAAGSVDLEIETSLVMQGGRISASSEEGGATGGLDIHILGDAQILEESKIESIAPNSTDALNPEVGDILFVTDGSLEIVDSEIRTNSARPSSGSIDLRSGETLDVLRSDITTNVDATNLSPDEAEQSGNIALTARYVVVDRSTVQANASGLADAGDIAIDASRGFVQSAGSAIEARSELGIDGRVIVNGPVAEILPGLVALAGEFSDPSDELRNTCTARMGPVGTFTLREDVAPPFSPDELFPIPKRGVESGPDPSGSR